MASEPDIPKTGTIAYVTAISLILILVTFLALQALFHIWETRFATQGGDGGLPSALDSYRQEQKTKLADIEKSQAGVLAAAKEGKDLSIKVPAATVPTKTPEKK